MDEENCMYVCERQREREMEYYSALKKKEILPYMTIQMNSEDIMLGEINQSLKDKYCMVPSL